MPVSLCESEEGKTEEKMANQKVLQQGTNTFYSCKLLLLTLQINRQKRRRKRKKAEKKNWVISSDGGGNKGQL